MNGSVHARSSRGGMRETERREAGLTSASFGPALVIVQKARAGQPGAGWDRTS